MKKRMKNRRGRLLIKNKNSSWIILNNNKFLLSVLLLAIVMVGFFITFNSPASQNAIETGSLAESSPTTSTSSPGDFIFKSKFYTDAIKPYIVPQEMNDYLNQQYNLGEFPLFIIGLITLLILFVVIYDIFTLIPIFSSGTMKIIAMGLGIIMVLLKVNVFFAAWLFTWGISVFAWLGSLAVFGVIIIASLILIGFFTGGNWIVEKMQGIRTMRENMETITKAKKAGGQIRALREEAKEAEKH